MITEDYVSFETTKLLREKGFNEPCNAYWFYMINAEPIFNDNMPRQIYNNKSDTIEIIGCPTLQMAMKWLREKYKLEIYPFHEKLQGDSWWYRIERSKNFVNITEYEEDLIFGSYEQACEAAIKYCLENLI